MILLDISRLFATKVPGKIDSDVLQLLWKVIQFTTLQFDDCSWKRHSDNLPQLPHFSFMLVKIYLITDNASHTHRHASWDQDLMESIPHWRQSLWCWIFPRLSH